MAVSVDKERAIHKAAIQVISEYGFHKAKMAKIAEVAGVSAGSLYTYYKDKDHILDRIFEGLWKEDCAGVISLAERKDLSPLEKLEATMDLIFDVLTKDSHFIVVFANEFNNFMKNKEVSFSRHYYQFQGAVLSVLKEGQAAEVVNPHIPAEVICHFILGGIRKSLYERVSSDQPNDWASLRTHIKAMIRRGVLA